MQNVFVQHGRMLVIVEYQKAQRTTNKAFFVVQALPAVVSQLLFNYLTFVRPFSKALNHQVNQLGSERPKTTSYIFVTSSGAPVQAGLLTAVIKKHSERDCKATLTVASYQQVVLAIAKRYIAIIA
jgi:hypothetical protein